ncbi:hypothetical protein HID58_055517, partial [Brassica napus]
GDGHDEASKFSPSRAVLLVARGDPPRAYYPSFCSCRLAAFQLSYFPSLSLIISPKSPLCSSGRVRSRKQRSEGGPSESMDSSGSSLDLTSAVENPSCEVADFASLSAEVDKFPPVGPLSSIGVDEVATWRAKYHLSDDVIIMILGPIDRVSDFEIDKVPEVVKKERKRLPVFDGHWTENFAFMYLPGFSTVWCTADIPSVDPSLGEKTIKQVLELPIERRQVPFLPWSVAASRVSSELSFCLLQISIRGNMSGSKGEKALAEYKRALEVMSAKKAAPKKAAPSENDDEGFGIYPEGFSTSSSDPAMVLANLNTKVFPLTPVILPEGDSSASIQLIQGNLLQAMSQMFHLGERMDDHASLKADLAELTLQLHEEKDHVLAKEKEIKALKLKVRNQDEAGALAAADNVSLGEELEQREEEV